mgnify:CR=1 FL=1
MRSLKLSVLRLIVVVSRLVLPHGCGKGLTVAPLASLLIPRLSVSAEPRIGAAASEITERFFASEIAQSDPTAREIDWAVEEVEAVHWHLMLIWTSCGTNPLTFLPCPLMSTSGSVRLDVSPPSGICQSLTVESSEAEAIMLSSKGFQSKSRTAEEWPWTLGAVESILQGLFTSQIAKGPPPPDTATAKYLALALI